MELKQQTYEDVKGNVWLIERVSLAKKRGAYVYWSAECTALKRHFREPRKKDVMDKIDKFLKSLTITTNAIVK